jgi:hypothetical protein
MRSQQYLDGHKNALKWAITFLHERAAQQSDPHAKAVLNSAAFSMGVAASKFKQEERHETSTSDRSRLKRSE